MGRDGVWRHSTRTHYVHRDGNKITNRFVVREKRDARQIFLYARMNNFTLLPATKLTHKTHTHSEREMRRVWHALCIDEWKYFNWNNPITSRVFWQKRTNREKMYIPKLELNGMRLPYWFILSLDGTCFSFILFWLVYVSICVHHSGMSSSFIAHKLRRNKINSIPVNYAPFFGLMATMFIRTNAPTHSFETETRKKRNKESNLLFGEN